MYEKDDAGCRACAFGVSGQQGGHWLVQKIIRSNRNRGTGGARHREGEGEIEEVNSSAPTLQSTPPPP